MAIQMITKMAEASAKVSETDFKMPNPWETGGYTSEKGRLRELEPIGERVSLPRVEVLRPNVEIIKNKSLQCIVVENRLKLQDIRKTYEEDLSTDVESTNADEGAGENENISESEEDQEGKELTDDEINEMQRDAIKDALERIRNGEKLTAEELGNLGEMMMDQYYISQGYKPLNKYRVTSLDDKKPGFRQGIDGVYEKTNPDGTKTYVIADAKYNTSQLSETNDGKQMSDNWIDKRLDDAVGKEKADKIRDAAEDDPDSVEREVYHIAPFDENGEMHTDVQEVDSDGNKVGEKTVVEIIDENGNVTNPSLEE